MAVIPPFSSNSRQQALDKTFNFLVNIPPQPSLRPQNRILLLKQLFQPPKARFLSSRNCLPPELARHSRPVALGAHPQRQGNQLQNASICFAKPTPPGHPIDSNPAIPIKVFRLKHAAHHQAQHIPRKVQIVLFQYQRVAAENGLFPLGKFDVISMAIKPSRRTLLSTL